MIHLVLRSPDAYQIALCRALDDHCRGEFVAWFQEGGDVDNGFSSRSLSVSGYRRLLRELNADLDPVVVLGGWSSEIAYKTIAIARSRRARLFIWADHPHPRERRPLPEQARRSYLRMLAKIVDGFLACGQPTVNHLESLGIPLEKITNFPYWIDVPHEWSPPPAAIQSDQSVPLRLIAIGRHVSVKCFDVAIHAVDLVNRNPGKTIVELELVGDGAERANLERLAESLHLAGVVKFSGWQDNASVWSRLRAADALVIPSRFEPYGVVVLEALASGRPVFASDQVIAALDRDDGSGAIQFHKVGDSRNLAQQIQFVFDHRAALVEYSNAARALAEKWPLELAPIILESAIAGRN